MTVPAASKVKNRTKQKKKDFNWRRSDEWTTTEQSKIAIEKLKSGAELSPLTSPITFFELFLTDELLEEITFQTNMYNTQRSSNGYKVAVKRRRSSDTSYKKISTVTKAEIIKFIGIVLYMGIHKLPNRRLYWGNKTQVPLIAEAMSRNRFEEILSILHFNDNQLLPTDRNAPD